MRSDKGVVLIMCLLVVSMLSVMLYNICGNWGYQRNSSSSKINSIKSFYAAQSGKEYALEISEGDTSTGFSDLVNSDSIYFKGREYGEFTYAVTEEDSGLDIITGADSWWIRKIDVDGFFPDEENCSDTCSITAYQRWDTGIDGGAFQIKSEYKSN